jgi:hypothetical protein
MIYSIAAACHNCLFRSSYIEYRQPTIQSPYRDYIVAVRHAKQYESLQKAKIFFE